MAQSEACAESVQQRAERCWVKGPLSSGEVSGNVAEGTLLWSPWNSPRLSSMRLSPGESPDQRQSEGPDCFQLSRYFVSSPSVLGPGTSGPSVQGETHSSQQELWFGEDAFQGTLLKGPMPPGGWRGRAGGEKTLLP